MKHLLLTMMALLCFTGTVKAQEVTRHMLVEGRTWKYQYNEMDWEQSKPGDPHYITYDCSLRIGGSTVFDGKDCHEVIATTPDETRTLGYAYEQDGQVYFHAQSEWAFYDASFPFVEGWAHLYDYHSAIGTQDGDLSTFGYRHVLDSVDVCQVNGCRFLRQYWKRDGDAKTDYDIVVGGIGCQNGFLNLDVSATNGASLTFLGCYEDGECIFAKDDFNAPAVAPAFVQAEVDGLKYCFIQNGHTATIENGNCWDGELSIPATVTYAGEDYTVSTIEWLGFAGCKTLTKVFIPATVQKIEHYAGQEIYKNIFWHCSSLQTIDVDADNQWLCSVDGVLYNKEMTQLYAYPAAAGRTAYVVPEKVTWIGYSAFIDCTNLKELVIEGILDDDVMQYNNMFAGMSTDVTLYVQASLVEKFRKVFSGTVLPLENYMAGIPQPSSVTARQQPVTYDLQGRPLTTKPRKGVLVEKGRKQVVN